MIPDAGTVEHVVDFRNLTVYNVTTAEHIFHPGHVARSVVVQGEAIYIRSVGEGIGPNRDFNLEVAGSTWAASAAAVATRIHVQAIPLPPRPRVPLPLTF